MKYAQKAADDLKSFVKKLQPLFDVASALEGIASLEQAAFEANKRKEDAYANAEIAKMNLVAHQKAEEEQKKSYEVFVEQANKNLAAAKEKAVKIVEDAQDAAKGIEAVAFKKLEEAEAVKQDALKYKLDIEGVVAARKLELEELNAKIGELKQRLANFLK